MTYREIAVKTVKLAGQELIDRAYVELLHEVKE